MKIIQITATAVPNEHLPRVIGLGEDGNVYQWSIQTDSWAPYAMNSRMTPAKEDNR